VPLRLSAEVYGVTSDLGQTFPRTRHIAIAVTFSIRLRLFAQSHKVAPIAQITSGEDEDAPDVSGTDTWRLY